MDKEDALRKIYEELKDKLDFDIDVLAIVKVLEKMLKEDYDLAINSWLYLLKHYKINEMMEDTYFLPLIKDYSTYIIKNKGLEKYLCIYKNLDPVNKFLMDNYVFNTFNDSSIKNILEDLIQNKSFLEEKEILQMIYDKKEEFAKEVFDYASLINFVVLKHLYYNNLESEILEFLLQRVDEPKEKAIIEAFLIDNY